MFMQQHTVHRQPVLLTYCS